MNVVAAIPARYGSTRLPGKPLLPILGRSMIERVYRQVERARSVSRTVVLTDDSRVEQEVARFGGEVLMTPRELASGTDRVAFAAREWSEEVVLNVQGDEPLIEPEALSLLSEHLLEHPRHPVATLAVAADRGDEADPNSVKVVTDLGGRALYFSRAAIPYPREAEHAIYNRHVGVYGYQRQALLEIAAIPKTPLELAESLEQLRMLESGFAIHVLPVPEAWPGVDTMADLEAVEKLLKEHGDPLDSPAVSDETN